MTAARVLGTLGKTVIAIGLIILLFGIFQLWGTGVIEARSQRGLNSEFADLLEASNALEPETVVPTGPPATPEPVAPTAGSPATPTDGDPDPADSAPTPAPAAGVDPTSSPVATPPAADGPSTSLEPHPVWLSMLYRDRGTAIARIEIPAIDVDKTVVEGVRVSDLRKAPGHYPATPMPGQAGNVAIAGHRTTYGAPFGDIDQLAPGDEIVITTIQGEFTYLVVEQGNGYGHLIVAPSAVEVLDQDFRDHPNRLTLTACHPKGSARQRIIVVAELVGDPAPTYARPNQDVPAAAQLADEDLSETDGPQGQDPAPPDAAQQAPPGNNTASTDGRDTEQTVGETTGTSAPEPAPGDSQKDSLDGALGQADDSGFGGTGTQALAAGPLPAGSGSGSFGEGLAEGGGSDSFGEGLDGDGDAVVPAVLWSLAALAIWLSALFVGQRWKRLPAYSLSAAPFLVVMFMAFWHIDRVLPSY